MVVVMPEKRDFEQIGGCNYYLLLLLLPESEVTGGTEKVVPFSIEFEMKSRYWGAGKGALNPICIRLGSMLFKRVGAKQRSNDLTGKHFYFYFL